MSIEEIIDRKNKLEKDITILVERFENETKQPLHSIEYVRTTQGGNDISSGDGVIIDYYIKCVIRI